MCLFTVSNSEAVLGSVAVYLPSNENKEANKLPTANDSLNWQYIFFWNKLGLVARAIDVMMLMDSAISTAESIPTKMLPGWRRTLKRAKPNKTIPLPPTVMKNPATKHTIRSIVMNPEAFDCDEPGIWIDSFEGSPELSFSVKGVAFIVGIGVALHFAHQHMKQQKPLPWKVMKWYITQ